MKKLSNQEFRTIIEEGCQNPLCLRQTQVLRMYYDDDDRNLVTFECGDCQQPMLHIVIPQEQKKRLRL